ncbi:MAG: FtsX-like permease family protein [Romboutsia sp.]
MNLIKNALANLKAHKLRVFVTLIWIIIGITSVIVVTSIGAGLEAKMAESTDKVSKKKTTIRFEPTNYSMMDFSVFLQPFTRQDIESISFMEGVQMVGPTSDEHEMSGSYGYEAFVDKKTTYIDLTAYKDDKKTEIMFGRDFTYDDDERKVVLITMQNATDLYENPENAIGNGISIDGDMYEVVGVLADAQPESPNQMNMMYGMGDMGYQTALMPKTVFDKLVNKYNYTNNEIQSIDILASPGYDVYEVANNISMKLQELHPDLDGTYMTEEMDSTYMELENMTSSIDKFVNIITLVSLFVGGIGVMNIMYMSVVERQKEIGIRRAIGAKPRNIMLQFLIEATFITIIGGILGMIVGIIAVKYISTMLPFKAILSAKGFMYASATSILTGIIFGLIPAFKASRLDPIKAIQK